jgi:hypothetical protein
MITLVGMPSGYLLSYSSPPWANSILSMSVRVSSLLIASAE